MNDRPTFCREERLWEAGYKLVAGVDEVGRGPLAGPVVAAAVILSSTSRPAWLYQLKDSKKLTARRRESLFASIQRDAVAIGVGIVSAATIDAVGIVKATDLAMCAAVQGLTPPPDFLLVDGICLPDLPIQGQSIIRGDNLSRSIAAASIVAKVKRDKLMTKYDSLHPGYGFARHKGYPTAQHLTSLQRYGCSPIHRRSFSPVRAIVEQARRGPQGG